MQGNRGSQHGDHIGVVFTISGKHCRNDLGLAPQPLREERSNGAVDQTTGENLLFGWAAFTLEKTTGNLARGECFLLVIDG